MSSCLLNFSVHFHNQSPVYVCVYPCGGCCSRHCAASLSSSHHSGRLSVHGAYSSLYTCHHGCDLAFSPAPGACSFSHVGSPCGGCASQSGLCPLCFVASPMFHCFAPLHACSLWPGTEVCQVVPSSSLQAVTEVQEGSLKCRPWPAVCCGPGYVGQSSNRSCQVPEAVADATGWVLHCYVQGELDPGQSCVGAQRLLCSTLFVVFGLYEDILSELLKYMPGT